MWTQGKGACVHTSHCQPWGAGGVDSQTPGPLLAQGGSLVLMVWAWKWDGVWRRARKRISHPAACSPAPPCSAPPTPDRPQPPSKPVVQQEDVKARSVLLSWEPGSDGLSPVR